ncbi:MAG: hypothetical protein MSG64_15370 [Pyrinomonadaceae bacterium MAG19_C2-C3]|nr:hypothetical protein [Pyrinomonadaceae bacterium MAG19_C2-C3]
MKRFLLPAMLTVAAPLAFAQTPNTQTPAVRPRTVTTPPAAGVKQNPSATPPQTTQTAQPNIVTPKPSPSSLPSLTNTMQVKPSGTTSAPVSAASPNAAGSLTPRFTPKFTPTPLPFIALKPLKPIAPNKIDEHTQEAKRVLRGRVQLTSLAATPNLYFVTLAALDPDSSQVHTLSIPKSSFLKRGMEIPLTTVQGMNVRVRVLRPNYVNTAIAIFDLSGRQLMPLVVEYPIEKFGRFREMAYYTSAHPTLISPELVRDGQNYVHTMIELAAKRLKDKGHVTAPEVLDIAERLAVVEHVDHQRFLTESRRELYEEVYALYALNKLDTYRYSVSTAGAGGMVQMIPATYQMMRNIYPAIGLNPDFVTGMRNHGNALEAMLLYMQMTWNNLLKDADVNFAYQTKMASCPELIAAGYNSNPVKLGRYINRGGTAWRTLIPRETQMYLQIYSSLESTIALKKRVEPTNDKAVKAAEKLTVNPVVETNSAGKFKIEKTTGN